MAAARDPIHGLWSSRWVFILAATGSAVGLGNIWRFPYVTGENGGGAFVLVYLACVALVGVPIMIAEIVLGRRGRRSPINTMSELAREEGLSPAWSGVGWMGVVAGFLILSFYSVVAGWSLAYVFYLGSGTFAAATGEFSQTTFDALIASPGKLLLWHSLFIALTIFVVSRGVTGGLEKAARLLMPALFLMLLLLVGYAASAGDFKGALSYLFEPDFTALSSDAILIALGQAFFSLSLGMGSIMVYGSYLPSDASIPSTAVTIAIADTMVAVLAGLAIFPIVLGYGLEPGAGPGLVFISLTVAFGQMPGGQFFGTVFFLLLSVAALTSAISLLEPVAAWLVESKRFTRRNACLVAGAGAWLLGIGSLLSFNLWSEVTLSERHFFGWMELISTTILLPLGGLLIAIFAGWRLRHSSSLEEFQQQRPAHLVWVTLTRFVAPVGVAIIFFEALS